MIDYWKIPSKWGIVIIIVLLISIGLNVYQLIPTQIDGKGALERLKLQQRIDHLRLEYDNLGYKIEEKDSTIAYLEGLERDPIVIIQEGNKLADEKYKIYKSYAPDRRVLEWIKKSRE
jgi:hypothetical protein